MEDPNNNNNNNINVGDVLTLKAKVLSRGEYCPASGYVYRLQLLYNRGDYLVQVDTYIRDLEALLDNEKPTTDSAFRPLKVGDIAKCIEVRNRKPNCGIDGVSVRLDGEIVTVITNEADRENNTVDIKFKCGTVATIDPVYLELLTPVEELKPYYAVCNLAENAFAVCRTVDGKSVTRMCYFYKEGTHEGEGRFCYAEMTESEAKKAAEDERDRLNEEWRKRHQYCNK